MVLLPSTVGRDATCLLDILWCHPGWVARAVGDLTVVDGKIEERIVVGATAGFRAEAFGYGAWLVESEAGVGKLAAIRGSVRLVFAPIPFPGAIAVAAVGVE